LGSGLSIADLPECGGRGVVTPIRRQQLLVKLKAEARERV
jgi:hypothetical protein